MTVKAKPRKPVAPAELARRRARRRERVVRRLLAVVERLLDEEDSYLDLSVERIIEEGEMARSTFYSYFDDKADLIVALGETAMGEIISSAQGIWELPGDATRDEVGDAVRRAIETYLPHTRVMNAVIEVAGYDRRARERFEAAYLEAQRAAAAHIHAGQKAGYVRPGIHADEAAAWFTWMAERGMTQLVQGSGRARIQRLEDTYADLLWYALYDGQGRPER